MDFVAREAGAERQQVALVAGLARQLRLGQSGVIGALALRLQLDMAEPGALANFDIDERVLTTSVRPRALHGTRSG